MVALSLVYRADALFMLGESGNSDFLDSVIGLIAQFWAILVSMFYCYRDSFKDMSMEAIGSPESVANATQIVGALSLPVSVLLLTLGLTVYHSGKFPKSKKTIGFEFRLMSAAFPHVCEGITAEQQSSEPGWLDWCTRHLLCCVLPFYSCSNGDLGLLHMVTVAPNMLQTGPLVMG